MVSRAFMLAGMTNQRPTQQVYEPRDVAARLGMSVAGLRRIAASYERVRGPLPSNERGRLWPEEAVEAMEEARALVRAGRAVSVEGALRGAVSPEGVGVPPMPTRAGAVDLEALAHEIRMLRDAVEAQNELLRDAVEEQTRLLREQGERLAAIEHARELSVGVASVGVEEIPVEEAPDRGGPAPTGSAPTGPAPVQTPRGFLRRLLGLR